jgi:hypothetical protein
LRTTNSSMTRAVLAITASWSVSVASIVRSRKAASSAPVTGGRRTTLDVDALVAQADLLLHRGLDRVAAHPYPAAPDLALADEQPLLDERDHLLSASKALGCGPGLRRPALAAPLRLAHVEVHGAAALEHLGPHRRAAPRAPAAETTAAAAPERLGVGAPVMLRYAQVTEFGVGIRVGCPVDAPAHAAHTHGEVVRGAFGGFDAVEDGGDGGCVSWRLSSAVAAPVPPVAGVSACSGRPTSGVGGVSPCRARRRAASSAPPSAFRILPLALPA